MATTKLQRTFGAGNQKIWTMSVWLKRSNLGEQHIFGQREDDNNRTHMFFDSSHRFQIYSKQGGTTVIDLTTNQKFRDVNAWYHLVVAIDTTLSTQTDRVKFYVNGVLTTDGFGAGYPNQDQTIVMNNAVQHEIGSYDGTGYYFDGLMSHFHFCDGTQLAATVFGETDATTGEWKIKTSPSFTLGTNGFTILKDANTVTDQSSNSNDWAVTGGTLTKSEDCPSNIFVSLNINDQAHNSTKPTIANGNTKWTASGNSSSNGSIRGTLGALSGKYYFEAKLLEATYTMFGFVKTDISGAWYDNTGYMGNNSGFYAMYINASDQIYSIVGGSNQNTNLGSVSNNDIIGCAFDFDNSKFYFHKNGTYISVGGSVGDPTSGSTGTGSFGNLASGDLYIPAITNVSYGTASSTVFNFGNGYFGTTQISSEGTNASGIGKFEYDVPTGYTALSTKGLNE